MGKTWKSIKRWGIGLGLAGALMGSSYGSIDGAYKGVLNTEATLIKNKMSAVEELRGDLGKDIYNNKISQYERDIKEIQERLNDFNEASESKKKTMIAKDFGRYGLTIKEISKTKGYIPTSTDQAKPTAKGLGYGALVGTGVAIGLAITRKKKGDKGMRQFLERKKKDEMYKR